MSVASSTSNTLTPARSPWADRSHHQREHDAGRAVPHWLGGGDNARMADPSDPSDPPARPRGFVCPDCGVPLRVLVTRRPSRDLVRRRRACPHCGHAVGTDERPVPARPDG